MIVGALGAPADRYALYGLSIGSAVPLPAPVATASGRPRVDLVEAKASAFRSPAARAWRPDGNDWFRRLRLAGGREYLAWRDHFEFLISPGGRRVSYRPLGASRGESLIAYLLGQVLSFSLLKLGIEALHATAVTVDGGCVAFVGDSGAGKSTLAAAFLAAGGRLLTDDLLVLETRDAGLWAHPGPPRIKLFPEVARRVLERPAPPREAMNRHTAKSILTLGNEGSWRPEPLPLRAIYVLDGIDPGAARHGAMSHDGGRGGAGGPMRDGGGGGGRGRHGGTQPQIIALSTRDAFLELTANTFNAVVTEQPRLGRLFATTASIARQAPVRLLRYRRDLAELPAVRAAVLEDLAA